MPVRRLERRAETCIERGFLPEGWEGTVYLPEFPRLRRERL